MYNQADLSLAFQSLSIFMAFDGNPFEAIGAEGTNLIASYLHDIARDGPAKFWWDQPFNHPAIARALCVNREEFGASFALQPFRYARIDKGHRILAAWPCPRSIGTVIDLDWLNVEAVISWDPVANTAEIMDDTYPQLIGVMGDQTSVLFADPRAFFTEWMRRRAAFAAEFQEMRKTHWSAKPVEPDLAPGALMVGTPETIRWRTADMPNAIRVVGIDPARVNKAILKSAQLPRCFDDQRSAA